jgi:CO dehydrogenase maturation factor
VRGIISELKVAGEGVTVVDMEAGLELFGRGTPGPSDLIVAVVEPSLWSIQTATRVAELARELGVPRVVAVANKVREDADAEWIRVALIRHGVEVIAVVPYDTDVSLADRKMSALLDIAPHSKAALAIETLVDCIEAGIGPAAHRPSPEQAADGHEEGEAPEAAEGGCPWVVDKY